jgi:predicted  nucleic acid-binding Zn ribbon protein
MILHKKKINDSKDSFCEKLEEVFDHFLKYHIKIVFRDFNAKLGRDDIFKLTIEKDSLHPDSNDNGVRVVRFATSKNLVVKRTMFSH